ncbi:hypothetical protein Tco_1053983 [Tanacetum coccineum]|uniref:Uncharacterized protein n=1 Tax=Tanacetum coccineum TaxID=301880 RepID=A0ABQ5GVE9_9ASTR
MLPKALPNPMPPKADSWNEEPCRDVHQVGDVREVEVLRSFSWPPSELITKDGVLPERGAIYHTEVSTEVYVGAIYPNKVVSEPGYDKQRQKTLVASRVKEVNMAVGDFDDLVVCCAKNTAEDYIMDSGASFHATYCKEKLERFKLRSGLKRRLISVGHLDEEGYHVGFGDQRWEVTKGSLVVARRNKRESLYMIEDWYEYVSFQSNVPDIRKKVMALHLLHQSEDPATMILLSKTTAGVTNGIVMLKMISETPLQFRVAEILSQTFRAESTGLRAEAPKMLWADSVIKDVCREAMKCTFIGSSSDAMRNSFQDTKSHQSPGVSSDTSEGYKNSRSFEDSGRSDEEYSEDGASSKEGGSMTPQVQRSTRESSAPVRVLIFVEDSWNEEPCKDVYQVGDVREVEVLHSFNCPPSELITEDGVLPERGYS